MSTNNIYMFSLRNKKKVNFRACKFWFVKWILTIVRGQVIKFDHSTGLILGCLIFWTITENSCIKINLGLDLSLGLWNTSINIKLQNNK